jgi:hypothetical protein
MLDKEEAYQLLGLSVDSSIREVEQRYLSIVRRLRANELRGFTTMLEEIRMKAATEAYRYILNQERTKILESYRMRKYSKFKRFSRLAERLDEFFYAHKIVLIFTVVIGLMIGIGYAGVTSMLKAQAAMAAVPTADLSIMITSDIDMDGDQTELYQVQLNNQLTQLWPELEVIRTDFLPAAGNEREIALYTQIPDLYLLDQDSFIILMKLGYMEKLEEWDTYGIDLSDGPLSEVIAHQNGPLIAAVSIQAEHHEQALSVIRHFVVD